MPSLLQKWAGTALSAEDRASLTPASLSGGGTWDDKTKKTEKEKAKPARSRVLGSGSMDPRAHGTPVSRDSSKSSAKAKGNATADPRAVSAEEEQQSSSDFWDTRPIGKSFDMDAMYEFDKKAEPVRQMTEAEYKALTPKQQAAVDFNTMLTKAVQADLKDVKQGRPAKPDVEYEANVASVFPEAQKEYAPRTVKLLASLGYKDSPASLDDFLQLRTAIDDDDLPLMDLKLPTINDGPDAKGPAGLRTDFQQALMKQFDSAIKKDEKSGQLMQQRNELLGLPELTGYGSTDLDETFRRGFDLLARADSPGKMEENEKLLSSSLGTPELWSKFLSYVDTRSKELELKNMPLGENTADAPYLDPVKFRELYVGGK